jgi:site-specific recombinase XerD
VRNIHGRRWNYDAFAWELPYTQLTLRFLQKYLATLLHWTFEPRTDLPERLAEAEKPLPFLAPKNPAPAKYEAAVTALEQCLQLKRYSWRTVKSYKNCFKNYILHFNDTKPSQLSRRQIDQYLLYMIKEKKISESHQNQIISALIHFYREVVKQPEKVEGLFRPKLPDVLPQVFTEQEVTRLLNAVTNKKHRCILMTIYSAGLRLSEVVNLRLPDLQPDYNRIFIRRGKGKKDRCTILSEKLKNYLQNYLEIYKPVEWLFEGQDGGQYSVRSVQAIFTRAKLASRVNPDGTVHTLRHSFATHLLEKGVDRTYIQDFLGHQDPRTTEIYLHITKKGIDKLKSPLDNLEIL